MPKQYRLERRSPGHSLADFDDQRWPIACALVALAGFLVGVIWARSDFEHPRLLFNGWAQLVGVAILLVVLIWSSALLEGRILRRVQLCVLLSLMLHLGLVLLLREQYLSAVAVREQEAQQALDELLDAPPDVLPEYDFNSNFEAVTTDAQLDAPVPTAEADAAEAELERQSETEAGATLPRPELPEPVPEAHEPNAADLQRVEVSAPKQAVSAGEELSRQEIPPELPPAEPIEAEQVREAPPAAPAFPEPREIAREDAASAPTAPAPADMAAERPPTLAARELPSRSFEAPLPAVDTSTRLAGPERQAAEAQVAAPAEVLAQPARVAPSEPSLAPTARDAVGRTENPLDAPAAASAPDVAARTSVPTAEMRRVVERGAAPAVRGAPVAVARQAPQDTAAATSTATAAPIGRERESTQPSLDATATASGPAMRSQPTASPSASGRSGLPGVGDVAATVPATAPRRAEGERSPTLNSEPAAAVGEAPAPIARDAVAANAAEAVAGDVGSPGAAPRAAPSAGAAQELAPAASAGRLAARTGTSSPAIPTPSTVDSSTAGGDTGATQPRPAGASAGVPRAPRRAELASEGDPAITRGGPAAEGAASAARSRATAAADDLAAGADGSAAIPEVGPTPEGVGSAGQPAGGDNRSGSVAASEPTPAVRGAGRMSSATATLPRGAPGASSTQSRAAAEPQLDVPAPARMAAGLRRDRAPALGLNDPLARPQSESLAPTAERFVLERSFGAPTINAQITENPIPEFRQRKPEERERNAASRGATAGSERAVELGLDFLARHQAPDGRWTLDKFDNARPGYEAAGLAQMQSDTAATGLALLAFFGAGYTHLDGKYRQQVGSALDYLVGNQKADGDLFTTGSPYVWLYSHGIASIALCEAYGMTRDPRLREPAQKALDFIIAAQHPTQGGWRYAPQRESDTSVSGWQMMALKSGELSGLNVPRTTYERLNGWLDYAQAGGQQGSRYVYLPASRQLQQRSPSVVMTAEALLMRLYLGWERNDPRLIAGADYLLANLPRYGTASQPSRDAYYWYYATQVMFQVQGPHWETWNAQLRDLLVNSQVRQGQLIGSWDPLGPQPDRWGRQAGRIYVTTMHLLMLEVYYRHLPLYRTLGQ